MDWWLLFAMLLYVGSACLILAEVFVPSGGLISVLAAACLVAGAVLFFRHSATVGWIGVIAAMVLIPTILIFAYKMFPHTRFGKAVMLSPSNRQVGDAVPDTDRLEGLLGKDGEVITDLRPVGMCDFSGQRVECVAEGGYIEQGNSVTVIRVQGTQLTVRVNTNES